MNILNKIAPKSFLGKYSIKLGVKCVGILMAVVSVICILVFIGEIVYYGQCPNCEHKVLHDVYSFSINIILYCFCIFLVNLWFIWSIPREKPAVALIWIVVTTMWWLQGTSLVLIVFLLNIPNINIGWIITLCLAVVAFFIFGYCILIGYTHWRNLKENSRNPAPAAQT